MVRARSSGTATGELLAALVALVVMASACGGGPEPPDEYDVAKITEAQNTLRTYCRKRVTDRRGARELGASEEVDLLVAEYRDYPQGTFELVPGEEPTTMREVLSGQAAELGQERCDPRLARRIEEALARP
jgi:hypothetical protein